jgi:sec-independent protein translocase protein TatA
VTWLEPRTQHQPGKLQKLSKNDCVSTLPAKEVNTFVLKNIPCIFNRVQPIHRHMPKTGAMVFRAFRGKVAPAASFGAQTRDMDSVTSSHSAARDVDNPPKTASSAGFARNTETGKRDRRIARKSTRRRKESRNIVRLREILRRAWRSRDSEARMSCGDSNRGVAASRRAFGVVLPLWSDTMFEGLFQPTHLLVILILCLIVFGPKKLPELGKGIGEGIRGFRDGVRNLGSAESEAKTESDSKGQS